MKIKGCRNTNKMDINDYIHRNNIKSEIENIKLVEIFLNTKGLVKDNFNLIGAPYAYNVHNVNKRGVACMTTPLNNIHINLNQSTSATSNNTYFSSIQISYTKGYYYFYCLAQFSNYKNASGAENIVYKIGDINDIPIILDEIFKNVKVQKCIKK